MDTILKAWRREFPTFSLLQYQFPTETGMFCHGWVEGRISRQQGRRGEDQGLLLTPHLLLIRNNYHRLSHQIRTPSVVWKSALNCTFHILLSRTSGNDAEIKNTAKRNLDEMNEQGQTYLFTCCSLSYKRELQGYFVRFVNPDQELATYSGEEGKGETVYSSNSYLDQHFIT